jgi:hypothetical protein
MQVTQQKETYQGAKYDCLANVKGTNVGHSYKGENYIFLITSGI